MKMQSLSRRHPITSMPLSGYRLLSFPDICPEYGGKQLWSPSPRAGKLFFSSVAILKKWFWLNQIWGVLLFSVNQKSPFWVCSSVGIWTWVSYIQVNTLTTDIKVMGQREEKGSVRQQHHHKFLLLQPFCLWPKLFTLNSQICFGWPKLHFYGE